MRAAYPRKSYQRSDGTQVSRAVVGQTCVTARGKAAKTGQKGTQLFHLEKDVLKPYGYQNVANMSMNDRHRALKRALVDIKPLPLFRRINALYVLNENQNPDLARVFKADRDFIKTTSEYAMRDTARPKSKSKSKSRSKPKRRSSK